MSGLANETTILKPNKMNLKNNSIEMKTVVETFVVEETAELIYDGEKLEQWNRRVAELGLTGQTQIVKPEKSPIPFMHLKKSMVAVFECLCPMKVDVSKYDVTPIPVEILDLVALSKREEYFDCVQIWYDDKNPDPVCIGIKHGWYSQANDGSLKTLFRSKEEAQAHMNEMAWTEKAPYACTWQDNKYLLGKWADVRRDFEELKEMATKRFIQQEGNDLRKKIKEAERGLTDLETTAFDKFN